MLFSRPNSFSFILLFGFLFISAFSFSQKVTPYKKKRFTFHIEKSDTSTAFDVFAVNPKITAYENSSYSWYSEGKILETKGGFSGKLLDGGYVSYYGNKNLRERGAYVKGRKEGKWMKWHSNGKINEITYWRMGEKQGKYILYNDLGQKMLRAHFKHDKLNGTLSGYEKDKVLSKTKYRNGVEVPLRISKGKIKSFDKRQRTEKPSFLKSAVDKIKPLFRKTDKQKEKKTPKEKKKKDVSMSSH